MGPHPFTEEADDVVIVLSKAAADGDWDLVEMVEADIASAFRRLWREAGPRLRQSIAGTVPAGLTDRAST